MKKRLFIAAALAVLAATPALAADMLAKKEPPKPRAPAWTWTGFYVGANFGGGWAKSDWFEDVSGSGGGGPPGFQDASIHASGVLGGGQIGFDWQNDGRCSVSKPTPMPPAFAARQAAFRKLQAYPA